MGIISPKKPRLKSKLSIALLAIALFPVLIIFLFLFLLWGAVLAIAIWITWKNPRVLFVYSDSPTWKDYIEREILPYLRDRAVILNWSERRNWRTSLPVLAFRYFVGDKNFNQIEMVFRPFHLVKTYRFYDAFKDCKHGNPQRVEEIRKKLFDDIGV